MQGKKWVFNRTGHSNGRKKKRGRARPDPASFLPIPLFPAYLFSFLHNPATAMNPAPKSSRREGSGRDSTGPEPFPATMAQAAETIPNDRNMAAALKIFFIFPSSTQNTY
jgi:hypothetical protein